MSIRILFFSLLRDITQTAETTVSVREGSTLQDLLAELYLQWPSLAEWDTALLLAVDQQYARRSMLLHDNAEVAIMPPVQGG